MASLRNLAISLLRMAGAPIIAPALRLCARSDSLAFRLIGLLGLPDQGLFARGDMRLFVTRCVGFYGYPMRVGIPPEIAVLVLRTPGSSSDPTPARAL